MCSLPRARPGRSNSDRRRHARHHLVSPAAVIALPKARTALAKVNDEDGIIFCEISLWEIAMLIQKGRLQVDVAYQELVRLLTAASRCVFRGISPEIAELSTALPTASSPPPPCWPACPS